MEYMATAETHTWFLSQASGVTYWAEVAACLSIDWCLANVYDLFACLFDTFWFQTRKTNLFTSEATTKVTALVNFSAAFSNESLAVLFQANFFKGGIRITWARLDLSITESAFSCILVILSILARHTNMIRRPPTRSAKVFRTVLAANSEFSHVLRWLFRYYFIAFISLVVVDLCRFQVDSGIAVASDHVWVQIYSHVHLFLFNLI